MAGISPEEGTESGIGVDIIDDDRAARLQRGPRPIQLKTYIPLTMKAVVDEKIDGTELRQQWSEALATRSPNEGPPLAYGIHDRDANLILPRWLERRKIDAPETSGAIFLERLKDEARGHAMCDPGFDDFMRSQMANQTP